MTIPAGTRFATIRPLGSHGGRQLNKSVEALASMLAGVAETGTVRITLRGKDKPLHLLVALGRKRGTTKAKGAGKPDLEVVLQEGTWWEIVEGRLSPPDAFRRGRMRIRGDVNLGSRLYKSLAADDGSTDICWG